MARIATYPFTSPVLDLVMEPSVLHALTETGLETYTLRAGYHTVREAEQIDGKTNALPPPSTPICLIGLRPFLGVRGLLLARNYLVLMSEPASGEEWTVYCLHLPSHAVLFQDMLQVADMNSGAPHGFLQLVSEAHVVARTWLHRLRKPPVCPGPQNGYAKPFRCHIRRARRTVHTRPAGVSAGRAAP